MQNNVVLNNIGSKNNNEITVNNIIENKEETTPTVLYELLKILNGANVKQSTHYSLRPPIDLSKKLKLNNAINYKRILGLYTQYMDSIRQILEGGSFIDSENIILKLNAMYLNVVLVENIGNPNIDGEGDIVEILDGTAVLKEMINNITEIVKHDKRVIEQKINREDIERFTMGLLSYSIEKCKVLENDKDDIN